MLYCQPWAADMSVTTCQSQGAPSCCAVVRAGPNRQAASTATSARGGKLGGQGRRPVGPPVSGAMEGTSGVLIPIENSDRRVPGSREMPFASRVARGE